MYKIISNQATITCINKRAVIVIETIIISASVDISQKTQQSKKIIKFTRKATIVYSVCVMNYVTTSLKSVYWFDRIDMFLYDLFVILVIIMDFKS